MATRGKYTKLLELHHHQSAAIKDEITGDVTVFKKGNGKIPQGKELVDNYIYKRYYSDAWQYLDGTLSALEFNVANRMAYKAHVHTNSLVPLNDNSTVLELSESLGVGKNSVIAICKKLFEKGVYARFAVHEHETYKHYWIFNPYLAFNGRLIDTSMKNLFYNTTIAKIARGEYSIE